MANIDIKIKKGKAEIFVGGVDVTSGCKNYTLSHYAGELPVLTVEYFAIDAEIKIDGEVHQ